MNRAAHKFSEREVSHGTLINEYAMKVLSKYRLTASAALGHRREPSALATLISSQQAPVATYSAWDGGRRR